MITEGLKSGKNLSESSKKLLSEWLVLGVWLPISEGVL